MPRPTDPRRAVALAGHLGDESAARAGLDDPAPAVRATALGALARLQRLTLDDVAQAAMDRDGAVRARAAELAAAYGGRSITLLMTSLNDDDPRVAESGCFA